MKRILEILLYLSNALSAITKGAQTANDNWPASNPFKRSIESLPVQKQQDKPDQ